MTKRDERVAKRSKYSDAYRRAEQKTSGDRTTIKVPDGIKLFSMKKEGVYRLDILPYVAGEGNKYADPGMLHYERTFFVHKNIGPNNETLICPASTWHKKCPICEYVAQLRNDPNHDKELIKGLYPKERQLFLVIDRDDRGQGVQIWDISFHLFGKLLDFRINKSSRDSGFGNFYHSDAENPGMYLEIGTSEKAFAGNKYYEAKTIDFIARKHPIKTATLDGLPCLDDLPKAMKYEKIQELFLQSTPEGEDDEDDQNNSAQLRREERRRKAAKAKDTDDDEDDDDEDEEETRSTTRGKIGSKRRPPVDDDEPEDDEDDQEDEDEDDDNPAPVKRRPGKTRRPPVDDDDDEDEQEEEYEDEPQEDEDD